MVDEEEIVSMDEQHGLQIVSMVLEDLFGHIHGGGERGDQH